MVRKEYTSQIPKNQSEVSNGCDTRRFSYKNSTYI